MNLPPPLASWAPYLREFPLEIAPALGELARHLAPLVGAPGAEFDSWDGEVDGYDGLAKRGSPERMLLSDWLLAGEVPDEWTRRAAEGELSYLQLARRVPHQSQAVLAIFDAGPEALGAPRLGQLAALLVLARRAREMDAPLLWGIAQKPTGQLWRDVSPSGARALLEARGAAPATAQDLEFWRAALRHELLPASSKREPKGEPASGNSAPGDAPVRSDAPNAARQFGGAAATAPRDELWLVGGRALTELAAPGESLLLFDDPFDVERALVAGAHRAGAAPREARLLLPDDATCTRLLRHPFGTPPDASGQLRCLKASQAPRSNLLWLSSTTLGARTQDGGLAVYRVPSSPRGGVPKPKHYHSPTGAAPHWVGEWNGMFLGARLLANRTTLRLERFGGRAQEFPSRLYSCAQQTPRSELLPLWCFTAGHDYRPVFPAFNRELLQLQLASGQDPSSEGDAVPLLKNVVAAAPLNGGAVALTGPDASHFVHFKRDARQENGCAQIQIAWSGAPQSAFWGASHGFLIEETGGFLGWQNAEGWHLEWAKDGARQNDSVSVAPGEKVWGTAGWKGRWPTPALVVASGDGRELWLRGLGWTHLIASDAQITGVSTNPLAPWVAWTTAHELAVYSLSADVVLARWQWEDL